MLAATGAVAYPAAPAQAAEQHAYAAAYNYATPVVTAVLFIFAVLVVLFNLIADVLYTVLDPRLRLA